jgi:hypothetical protein
MTPGGIVMASGAGAETTTEIQQERFHFFVSYASEDRKIADAVETMIKAAMGPSADVFLDEALSFGVSFEEEIKKKLDETNVLVVVHSGILKPAFAFPGLELGYFMRIMEGETRGDFPRRIVPIYSGKPPDSVKGQEGIDIGISRETLNMTLEEYTETLKSIDWNHGAVRFLRQFQGLIDGIREKHGLELISQSEEQKDLPGRVRKMLFAIFSHLKTTADPESNLKPQLQIMLKTNDTALSAVGNDSLPDDARLVGVGAGRPLSIFGIQGNEITWGSFKQQIAQNKFRESWMDALTTVVISSIRNQPAVDNSQIILAHNAMSTYRVILTAGIRYFNGNREFNLYFIEYLRRDEFGDPKTTSLIKGLDLACRFRSLFLEPNSKFSSVGAALALADPNKKFAIQDFASSMERELNLLHRDALEARLDDPTIWLGLVDSKVLLESSSAWLPLESKVREVLIQTRRCEPVGAEKCREALIAVLKDLETTMRPLNSAVIAEMADKLKAAAA